MDKFKAASMNIADGLDWNANHICKRRKGDTRRAHKSARTKLKQDLIKEKHFGEEENKILTKIIEKNAVEPKSNFYDYYKEE